jgi:hypothetical protein
VDLQGYASMAAGGGLDIYYSGLNGAPDKSRLKFAKKFAKARGLEGDKKGTLNELYKEFDSFNITSGGDRSLRAVMLVEQGDTNITLMRFLLTELGGYFSDEWESNPDLQQALHNRVSGLKAGDVVDVSDFWGFSALSTDDQAAQNSAIYEDYRRHGGYVPFFSSWVAGYAHDIETSFDEQAPPRLQYSSRVNLGANAAIDATLFYEGGSLAFRGAKGFATTGRLTSKGFTGTAGVKDYFRKLWSGEIGGRLNVRNYRAEGLGANLSNIKYRPKTKAANEGISGRVQSRINLAKGQTKFTPLRKTGEPVSAGWEHLVHGHFNRSVSNNRSVFSISQNELKAVLQSKQVVNSPVTAIPGGQYVRTVEVGRTIGTSSLNRGGGATSMIKVFTDKAGNLITAYPH